VRRRLLLPVLLAVLAATGPAGAHEIRIALTTVEPNPRSGLVEVMHRFWVHDAEHATQLLGGMTGDIVDDVALQRLFSRYVAQRFTLADADREPLALELVGAEVDGDFLWVYEQMPIDRFDAIRAVAHSSLQDVWTDQVNQVNVRRGDAVRTLYLQYGEGLQPIRPFEEPAAPREE
jgi:hypothetical protein